MELKQLFLGILLLAARPQHAQSQKDTLVLDSVVITENRIRTTLKNSSRQLVVISSSDFTTSLVRSTAEVLSYQSGVDVRQRGVNGMQSDISIRGGSFEQTLLLVNGMKITDPQTGHHVMNLPVPLEALQRVEIVKGSAASIYGQNAFAGAVNLITKLPDQFLFRGELSVGDFNMQHLSFYGALPYKRFKHALALMRDYSSGYQHNSDYTSNHVFYENAISLGAYHVIKGLFSYSNRRLGANGYYSNRFPDQYEAIESAFGAIDYQYERAGVKIKWRAYGRQNHDEFLLKRYDPSFYRNRHTTTTLASELHINYLTKYGQSGIGLEVRDESIRSTNLGQRNRQFAGLFAEHKYVATSFDFRAGVYANYFSGYGVKFFPGAEAGYHLSKNSKLFSSIGYSYRIPTYTELYYIDPTTLSNPGLKPENALTYDLGYRLNCPQFKSEVVFYRRETNNLIDYYRATSDLPVNPNYWIPQNILKVDFNGLEVSGQYYFKHDSVKFGLKSVQLSWHYIDATIRAITDVETKYALNALRQQVIVGLEMKLTDRVLWSLKGRYLLRQNSQAYTIVDTKLVVNINKRMSSFVLLTNAFNTNYIEAGYVNMPGRWISGGMRFLLK